MKNLSQFNTPSPLRGVAALPHATIPSTPQPPLDDTNYNTGSSLRSATALHPHSAHPYITKSSQNEAQQIEFLKALQLPSSTHEKLDDVSTWGLDTLLKVATDLCNDPELTVFDYEDQCVANNSETTSVCELNNNDSEGEVSGVYGGVICKPKPRNNDPAGTGYRPLRPENGCRRPRVKMYELQPFSDPEREKQRLRAVRQRQRRQEEKKELQKLQKDLEETRKEVSKLTPEANRIQGRVQELEQLVMLHGLLEQLKN